MVLHYQLLIDIVKQYNLADDISEIIDLKVICVPQIMGCN